MDISGLWSLQCMMFLLVAAGAVLKRKGVLTDSAKGVLTDLVLYFFLPCNIINSFRMDFNMQILKKFAVILLVSLLIQLAAYGLSRILYNRKPKEIKRVMQYCTIVSNSGFLGLPIAEGLYGAEGMMYASIFIIPIRVMMWSAGIACFTESPDFKSVIKKILVHPCIVAVYIGLGLMIFQTPLMQLQEQILTACGPQVGTILKIMLTAIDKSVKSAGGCTTALTMVLIGMMMADVKASGMLDKNALFISVFRLVIMPGLALVGCRLVGIDDFLTGICVLMTGMPAGSTSAILAAKYDCDYMFATKCIVVSTLFSMLTIPVWGMVLG